MRDNPLPIEHELAQQLVLGGRQADLIVAQEHPALKQIYVQRAARDLRFFFGLLVLTAPEHCPHTRQQFFGAEWLGDIVIGAYLKTAQQIGFARPSSDHDHRHAAVFAHAPADLVPVQVAWQNEVQQDQIGLLDWNEFQRPLAVTGADHVIAGGAQDFVDQTHEARLVIYHQDAFTCHDYSLSRSALRPVRGKVKWSVAPCPNWLSAQMRPPCVSTMLCEMGRPKPDPDT